MAADDDDRGPAPDPWDEIVSESLGEAAGEVSFRFEEASADVPPPSEVSAEPTESAAETEPGDSPFAGGGDAAEAEAPAEAAADAFVEDWLSGGDGDTATPPLVVFDPGEAATGSSGIDIGTGGSGVGLHGAAEQEEIGADAFAAAGSDAEEAAGGWPAAEETAVGEAAGDEEAGGGFPDVAAEAASPAGAAVTKTVRRPAKPAKKTGGIGQLIGVVLGGAMAIPITLAILIYGLGKDPFGVTKQVPAEVAFLLPEKFRPGYKKPRPADTDVAGESALDSLPTVTEPAEPVAGTDAPVDEPAPVEPPDIAPPDADMPTATDVAAVDAPGIDDPEIDDPGIDDPGIDDPGIDDPGIDDPGIDAPGLDDLGAKPAPVVPVEPPPLDTAALDAAVGDAMALGEALGLVDDTANDAYEKLRISWYKALARVAVELVAVEDAAAISGRPLAGATNGVATLHEGIGSRERLAAELAALAPDWLAYAKRGSDGIVVPVTFESAGRFGPFWRVKVSLTGPDGKPRDLTVISRNEPAAITGDRVVVTGLALDGDAIWAADVRSAAAAAPAAGF